MREMCWLCSFWHDIRELKVLKVNGTLQWLCSECARERELQRLEDEQLKQDERLCEVTR